MFSHALYLMHLVIRNQELTMKHNPRPTITVHVTIRPNSSSRRTVRIRVRLSGEEPS